MKIYLTDDDVIATDKPTLHFLLEGCDLESVKDKVAYWRRTCFYDPEKELAYEAKFKYRWKNNKTGTTILSRSPELSNIKLNVNDYERVD